MFSGWGKFRIQRLDPQLGHFFLSVIHPRNSCHQDHGLSWWKHKWSLKLDTSVCIWTWGIKFQAKHRICDTAELNPFPDPANANHTRNCDPIATQFKLGSQLWLKCITQFISSSSSAQRLKFHNSNYSNFLGEGKFASSDYFLISLFSSTRTPNSLLMCLFWESILNFKAQFSAPYHQPLGFLTSLPFPSVLKDILPIQTESLIAKSRVGDNFFPLVQSKGSWSCSSCIERS